MSYNWKCCSFYPNNFGASALNADSATRRPQVRLHCPQVGTRCPLITYLH